MKNLSTTVLYICFLAVVGCGQRGESPIVESGHKNIKDTMVGYYISDGDIFLIVWCGVLQSRESAGLSTGCSSTSSSDEVEVHGSFWTSNSKTIEYRCRTSGGNRGAVVIGGAEYNLAQGGIFLIGEQDEGFSVSQLDLDLSSEYKPRYTLESLANTSPQIAGFVRSFERVE